MHRIPRQLLENVVRVDVVGCGGTGSAIAAGLVYLHQAMLAFGHPAGLDVCIFDADVVSPHNCVRQAFTRNEVGLSKAVVTASRINMFWGLEWKAWPVNYSADLARTFEFGHPDIVIGCVDTRAARSVIADICKRKNAAYWLDLGNTAEAGQYVLGQPRNSRNLDRPSRLQTAAELYPEIVDPALDDDAQPSCSAIEALMRQAPFVNQTLANHALSLLARLFRYGQIDYHAGFVNLQSGIGSRVRVPEGKPVDNDDRKLIMHLHRQDWGEAMLMEAFDLDEYALGQIIGKRDAA